MSTRSKRLGIALVIVAAALALSTPLAAVAIPETHNIVGRVLDVATLQSPGSNAAVIVYTLDYRYVGAGSVGADGSYGVEVPVGQYKLFLQRVDGSMYPGGMWYEQVPAGDPWETAHLATVVDATQGDASGIDFLVSSARSISGEVLDSSTQLALLDARITVFDSDGNVRAEASPGVGGDYVVGGLQPGMYKVRASAGGGRSSAWYGNLAGSPDNFASAAIVDLTNADATGINLVSLPVIVHLVTGWNLIGNPAEVPLSLPKGLVAFSYASGIYVSTTALEPGEGVWIKSDTVRDLVLELQG